MPEVRQHLACDGKELCGTRRSGERAVPRQGTLGIYNVTGGYMEEMLAIAGKGQEAATLTAYLQHRDLCNVIITADALHTQRRVCRQICQHHGDYLLVVKRNQRSLYDDIRYLFSLRPNPLFPEQAAATTNAAHGRCEVRSIRTSTELNEYIGARWPGVAQVFQVERRITKQALALILGSP